MICRRCRVEMKSGTSYEHRNDHNYRRRFYECPRCHERYLRESMTEESVKMKNVSYMDTFIRWDVL